MLWRFSEISIFTDTYNAAIHIIAPITASEYIIAPISVRIVFICSLMSSDVTVLDISSPKSSFFSDSSPLYVPSSHTSSFLALFWLHTSNFWLSFIIIPLIVTFFSSIVIGLTNVNSSPASSL